MTLRPIHTCRGQDQIFPVAHAQVALLLHGAVPLAIGTTNRDGKATFEVPDARFWLHWWKPGYCEPQLEPC